MTKQIFLLLPFLVFCNTLIGQDTLYYTSEWKETDKKSAYNYRVTQQKDNLYLVSEYFKKNDLLRMQGQFSSLDPDIKEGKCMWYHSNGKLKHVGEYLKNVETGEHKWYFENGNPERVENFLNGQRDGYFQEFNKNGELSNETTYIIGKNNGSSKIYREDGSLFSEGNLLEKEKNGLWKYYNTKGVVIATELYDREFKIERAKISMRVYNSKWFLYKKNNDQGMATIFNREAIKDDKGQQSIPTIKLYSEDASGYPDVTIFAIAKQSAYKATGVVVDEILTPENKNCPINSNNAIVYKCHFHKDGQEHLFLMAYLISKDNIGIQIYLDMNKSLEKDYQHEFTEALKSIQEL